MQQCNQQQRLGVEKLSLKLFFSLQTTEHMACFIKCRQLSSCFLSNHPLNRASKALPLGTARHMQTQKQQAARDVETTHEGDALWVDQILHRLVGGLPQYSHSFVHPNRRSLHFERPPSCCQRGPSPGTSALSFVRTIRGFGAIINCGTVTIDPCTDEDDDTNHNNSCQTAGKTHTHTDAAQKTPLVCVCWLLQTSTSLNSFDHPRHPANN